MRFQNQPGAPKKSSTKSVLIVLSCFAAIIVIISIIVINLARGQTTTSGVYPAPVSTDSLSCTSTAYQYPFFTNTSDHTSTKINLTLGKSTIESVSLTATLTYDTEEDAEAARNFNQAAMNSAFTRDHLDVGLLEPNYTKKDKTFILTLYAASKNLNSITAPYFALSDVSPQDYNQKSLSAHYAKLGFNCTSNK